MTLDDTIKQVLELDEKATERPWQQCDFLSRAIHEVGKCSGPYLVGPVGKPINSELIVHYRTSAPLLAKACQRMKEADKIADQIGSDALQVKFETVWVDPKNVAANLEQSQKNMEKWFVALKEIFAAVDKMFGEEK